MLYRKWTSHWPNNKFVHSWHVYYNIIWFSVTICSSILFEIVLIPISGDVGGVLGLFLGASAFTIIEFGQFFVFAIAKWCFNYQGPKRSSKQFEKKNDNSKDVTIEMELPKNLLSLQNGRSWQELSCITDNNKIFD